MAMILGFDVGNTSTSFAALKGPGEAPFVRWGIPTHPHLPPDELRSRIAAELSRAELKIAEFEAVVISSVVPAVTASLREAFPQCLVIDSSWPFSFRIGTDSPERTGIDRLVNAEAFVRENLGAAILVDAGTATTICAVGVEGPSNRVFLGGAILPGLEILRDALAARTPALPVVRLEAPAAAIGTETESALKSGLVLGYASMIDGMIGRFREELLERGETSPTVIATGGLSSTLQGVCREITTLDPELTFKGIRYLYESIRSR